MPALQATAGRECRRFRLYDLRGFGACVRVIVLLVEGHSVPGFSCLRALELIPRVVVGVRFVDGEEQSQQAA
jgi:hypothetical protein